MTAIVSLFGIIGRFAGDLINSATGWAGSLMFGRVPQSHRRYLTAILGGSVLWVVLVIAFLVPGLLIWGLQTTPHPVVHHQLVARVRDHAGRRPRAARASARPRTWPRPTTTAPRASGPCSSSPAATSSPRRSGACSSSWPGSGSRARSRSARHRWTDTHIPIVVPPKGYDDTVRTIHDALAEAGLSLKPVTASRALSLPAWVITHLAGPNVRRVRPDRIVELRGDDVRVGIYPSDVAVSTTARAPDAHPRDDPRRPRGRGCPPHGGRRGAGRRGPAQGDGRRRHREPRPAAPGARARRHRSDAARAWTSRTTSGTCSTGSASRPSVTCCAEPSARSPSTATRSPTRPPGEAPASPSMRPVADARSRRPRCRRCDRAPDPARRTRGARYPGRHRVERLGRPRGPRPRRVRGADRRPGRRRRLSLRPAAPRLHQVLEQPQDRLGRVLAVGELPADLPRRGLRRLAAVAPPLPRGGPRHRASWWWSRPAARASRS